MADHKPGEATTWVIPIEITVRAGAAAPQTVTVPPSIPAAANPAGELRQARKAIQEDPSAYHDETADLGDREAFHAALEANFSLNCEHVVPQSWFRKNEPRGGKGAVARAIQQKQGNRNPLIDHPKWAAQIDFTRGL